MLATMTAASMDEGLVHALKGNRLPLRSFTLPIVSPDQQRIGSLRLIDRSRADAPDLVAALTRWRNASMRFFLSQFTATEARTRQWLSQVVLPADDRLLFELLDEDDRPIGHAGLCNLTEREAELDNFIRGEPGGDPRLFMAAELAMLRWMFCVLGLETVRLHVFSNNWIPINNHLGLGFTITARQSLSKVEEDGHLQHLVDSPDGEPVKYAYLTMSLSKADFLARQERNGTR